MFVAVLRFCAVLVILETLPRRSCKTCHLVASCCRQMDRVPQSLWGGGRYRPDRYHHVPLARRRIMSRSGLACGKVLAAFHPSTLTPASLHPARDDSSLEHLRVPHLEESAAAANDLAPLRANQAAPPAPPSSSPCVRTTACYCFLCCYPSTVTCPAPVRATSKACEHRRTGNRGAKARLGQEVESRITRPATLRPAEEGVTWLPPALTDFEGEAGCKAASGNNMM